MGAGHADAELGAAEAPVETLLLLPGLEGQLIDIMQTIVDGHPDVSLSCLPHMDGDYRETELGLRGQRELVQQAASDLTRALEAAGFKWRGSGR